MLADAAALTFVAYLLRRWVNHRAAGQVRKMRASNVIRIMEHIA